MPSRPSISARSIALSLRNAGRFMYSVQPLDVDMV